MTDHIPNGSLWLHDAMQIIGGRIAPGWTGTELSPLDRRPWGSVPTDCSADRWMTEMGESLLANKPLEAANKLRAVAGWLERHASREKLGLWFISETTLRPRTLRAGDFIDAPEGRAAIATGFFYQAPVYLHEDELERLLSAELPGAVPAGTSVTQRCASIPRQKRGAKHKVDPIAFERECRRIIAYRGMPDPALDPLWTKAELERQMLEWHGDKIGERRNRDLVTQALEIFAAEGNKGQ